MLPAFLRYLRDNHYRVVHLVPAGAKTVSARHINADVTAADGICRL